MTTIIPFLRHQAFDPADIHSMSLALEHVCLALGVDGHSKAREEIAVRIVDLASRGERNWTNLRDRVLLEVRTAAATSAGYFRRGDDARL